MNALQDFISKQPQFLTENWLQVIHTADPKIFKCIRVLHNVINVYNGHILIRVEMPTIAGNTNPYANDGFYNATTYELMRPSGNPGTYYPDVCVMQPDLQTYGATQVEMLNDANGVLHNTCGEFCGWLQALMKDWGSTSIFMDTAGAAVNWSRPENIPSFNFPFGLQDCWVHPQALIYAFKENMRYPVTKVTRAIDNMNGNREPPLIVGTGWKNCAIISTRR